MLYADYILERKGYKCIHDKHGFASFKIEGDECYVEDVYVIPSMRRGKHGTYFMDCVSADAKSAGCKYLSVTIVPSTNGSTESLKAALAYGFKLKACYQNVILMVKEL